MTKDQYLISKANASLKQKVKDPEFMTGMGAGIGGMVATQRSLNRIGDEAWDKAGSGFERGFRAGRWKIHQKLPAKTPQVVRRNVVNVGGMATGAVNALRNMPGGYKGGLAVSGTGIAAMNLANRRLARENKKKG